MATIKCFEEVKSWQKAREVCKYLGVLIDQDRFKKNYRLIHQIEGSAGSIMDNMLKALKEGLKENLFFFLVMQKSHVEN